MLINRKKLFKIHSWIGVKLSVLFFVVCFSGTLAVLSSEMDYLVQPGIRATPQPTFASKNTIVKNLRERFPDADLGYWAGAREPYLCDLITVKRANGKYTYVFANPYTGEIQGTANLTVQRYFRDLHYYLFIPFQVGHFTVLLFAFLLLFSLLTALLFSKKWYRKFLEIKRGKGRLVYFRSLHRLVGAWTVPFLLLFALTGVWYFLERTNTAGISRIANTKTPEIAAPLPDSTDMEELAWQLDYDRAVDSARAYIPGLIVKDIAIPRKPNRPIYLTGISDVPLVRNRANRVYVHPGTYEVTFVQKAAESPTVTWLNDIMDPIHFGSFGGLWTKLLWFCSGLGISGLILTGIYISRKRKVKNEVAQKAQRLGGWKYYNWGVVVLMFVFMFYILITRYQADLPVLLFISGGWALMGLGAWYLFVYRLQKAVQGPRPRVRSKGPRGKEQSP
ncbi:MAG: PepSY-associated TM helix domain-containing protein [Bacteroidota bacterium]